jgi:hypothetical protein
LLALFFIVQCSLFIVHCLLFIVHCSIVCRRVPFYQLPMASFCQPVQTSPFPFNSHCKRPLLPVIAIKHLARLHATHSGRVLTLHSARSVVTRRPGRRQQGNRGKMKLSRKRCVATGATPSQSKLRFQPTKSARKPTLSARAATRKDDGARPKPEEQQQQALQQNTAPKADANYNKNTGDMSLGRRVEQEEKEPEPACRSRRSSGRRTASGPSPGPEPEQRRVRRDRRSRNPLSDTVRHASPVRSHTSSHLAPHTSHLAPRTSHFAPRTSHLAPRTSHLTPHTSRLAHRTSQPTLRPALSFHLNVEVWLQLC